MEKPTPTTAIVMARCASCNGRGSHYAVQHLGFPTLAPCPDCNGQGVIPTALPLAPAEDAPSQ